MNDIDIEEYNSNIIQELNAAEEEGECSLSIFLHDLIEIDIESNFTFNYKVIDRIIDICINSLNSHMTLLAHECMYFVRYCINKCINIKDEINENFFKNLNIIIDICLNENKFSDDSFLLFERTFFFFVLDLNNVTNLIEIWNRYNVELSNFYKSLLHIISFHLSLLNEILNNLKTEEIDINYIQKGYSRIKIIEIAFDLLLNIFQNTEEIQNINNFENYINIIIKEYENVPDIEIKKKILSLLKIIHKYTTEKKIDNFTFRSQVNNLISKKINYYLTLTKEKDINIDYLKDNSYIYINNSIIFVKTFNHNHEEKEVLDKIILTPNGYKGSLLMNIFYAYFYNTKNKLLMVLSYDRMKIKDEENSKIITFYFKKNDAIGVLSNKLRKNFEDRLLDNVEISISFSAESIKKKVNSLINNVIEIENISDDNDEKKEEGEGIYLKDNLYLSKLKNDINNDPNKLIKNNDNSKEKVERRKVSFATTKEICLLNDNISVKTKTVLLDDSLNNIECNNNDITNHDKSLEIKNLVNNDILDSLFNNSMNLNENISLKKGNEVKTNEGNPKISYATTKDLIKESDIYDDDSMGSNQFYECSLNESSTMNVCNLSKTFNENMCAFNNEMALNNHENVLTVNLFEEKNNQNTKLNNYSQNQNIINNVINDNSPKMQNSNNKNIKMDIQVVRNSSVQNKTYHNHSEKNEENYINECERNENKEKKVDSYEKKDVNKNIDKKNMHNKEASEIIQSKKDNINSKCDLDKNINKTKNILKNFGSGDNQKNLFHDNTVENLKFDTENEGNTSNYSQNIYLNKNDNIIKSPIEIVKELLNYDEKQKSIDECIQSLKKYDECNKMRISNDTKNDNILISKIDNICKEKKENLGNISCHGSKMYSKKTYKEEKQNELKIKNILGEKELSENVNTYKNDKIENVKTFDDIQKNNRNATKEYSEIVSILGNDEPSNEIILNNEVQKEHKLKESHIEQNYLSSKNKKRISTNTFNNSNDYYLKNNIDSPYPIKKVKFNNYDSAFLDILKKEDNLENLSAKYLIKAYTLIQYNKRYIKIQIIDYFRYIRKEILQSYEQINMKYSNLLKELQLEYEMRFQNVISKYSNRLITKKKNINMNVPKPIDLNLIKEKFDSLFDTFNIVQRTMKDKISNSKILMKYKQSDIYTPSFSLGTIISKHST
ncbi:conserved Plasmodium protein, unknown function [Plasmodium gallinaceum]|uniref:Uncharacterized protein n=1 Tax=Plasmodium gallinaceum TaxID=5849 RepID=A0A1J1GV38_PLAGA|nr:conserved Plasmodium protein, unknown function [Plasmodium gallinaceum]CRG96148.1 conserved Plasmodium protein, unknown function [Plasmodium gallinaceum]